MPLHHGPPHMARPDGSPVPRDVSGVATDTSTQPSSACLGSKNSDWAERMYA